MHAGVNGMDSVFMGIDGTSSRVSNSSIKLVWFSRFMQECHKRMGT